MEQLKKLALRAIETVQAFRSANRQMFSLIVGAIGLALVLCALLYLLNPGAPIVLTSNLSPADRTALALRLRRYRVDFTQGADSISVPNSELAQARRILESTPGFSGGTEDFSLFDRSTMGESEFDEQVNYQRSLQGEIERTLMDIQGVDNARVMLAMGNSSAFGLAPIEAERASVVLTVAPGAIIDLTMARAIAHLVAGSVRGLSAENVTITDNNGLILYPPQREGELGEAIRLRNDFERRLQEKVASLLTRIMGENRYAVEVAVDVDTSRQTRQDSLYGKGDQAIVSEEHSLSPAPPSSDGIPGLTSNLPAPSPSPSAASSQRNAAVATVTPPGATSPELVRKDIINYRPSTREVKTLTAPVRIKQITVAAVLDGTYEGGRFRPLPAERLAAIKSLLAAAVGAQRDRGDSVEVQSAALSQPYVPPVPNPLTQLRVWLNDPVHMFTGAAAALVAFIAIIWVVKRILFKGARARARAQTAKAVLGEEPAVSAQTETALQAAPSAFQTSAISEFETLRSELNQQVARDPSIAAEVLRKWLIGSDGAADHVQNESDGE
jgi:flagellar M-ring protein FliF